MDYSEIIEKGDLTYDEIMFNQRLYDKAYADKLSCEKYNLCMLCGERCIDDPFMTVPWKDSSKRIFPAYMANGVCVNAECLRIRGILFFGVGYNQINPAYGTPTERRLASLQISLAICKCGIGLNYTNRLDYVPLESRLLVATVAATNLIISKSTSRKRNVKK